MAKKQKTILKKSRFPFLKYASNTCVLFPILFIAMVVSIMMQFQMDYQTVINENPILLVGFVVSIINLLIWKSLKNIRIQLEANENVHFNRLMIYVYIFILFVTLNYPSSFMLGLTAFKYFDWKKHSLQDSYYEVKKESKLKWLILMTLGYVVLAALSFWFLNAFR